MLKFSACIEMLFGKEMPFVDRIGAAAACGMDAFEFWSWSNKDIEAVDDARRKHNIKVASLLIDSAHESVRETLSRGVINVDVRNAFVDAMGETIEVAKKLDAYSIIFTTGKEQPGSRYAQHDNVVRAMQEVAPMMEQAGILLVLEPLNRIAKAHLVSAREGFDMLHAVDHPYVKMLFDFYHQQITEGDLINTMRNNIEYIGHLHVSDVPTRQEPGTGEINYDKIFEALEPLNYPGYVGLEYNPSKLTAETLGFTNKYR